MKPKKLPSFEELDSTFMYDPETGLLSYKKRTGSKCNMQEGSAGSSSGRYKTVSFKGMNYLQHRVAWKMHYKSEPPQIIDHINFDKHDNRIVNLREATKSQNIAYSNSPPRTSTGIRGLTWCGRDRNWRGKISLNGTSIIRYSKNRDEVVEWLKTKREELYGEFCYIK